MQQYNRRRCRSRNRRHFGQRMVDELAEAAAHRLQAVLDRPGRGIAERDAPAGARHDLGDPAPHLARTDDDDVLEIHARRLLGR